MARISTYDRDLVLSRDDILIGSDAENTSVTRNYSVGSLIDFISLSSGGVVDTNYYLSAITANQTTGVVTFTVNGIQDQTLTLGTAAFSASTDFAPSNVSFNTSQVISENDITAYYLNVSGNGTAGQLLASDGDGSFSWVSSASISDTNFYLNGITKNGNVLTFAVNGASDQTFTFGSAAFESVASIKTQLASGLAVTDLDTSGLGTLAFLAEVDTNEIANDSITTLKVAANAITEEKLKISNSAVSGYALVSDGADGFSWAANSTANYYLTAVTQNNNTLTFDVGGGFSGTDPTFTFGGAAFKDVEATVTGRNSARIPRADHTHSMSHVTDAGSLATLSAVGTSNISNSAVTAAKLSPSVGTNGQVLALDGSGNLVWTAAGAGASNFLALSDTPSSYTANPGDILKVNSGTNGLEFSSFKVSNVDNFTTVNTGTAGKVLAIDVNNQGGTNHLGLKWIDTSQVGATTFTGLTDTASSIGSAHQIAVVNAAANKVEFRTLDANMVPDDIITSAKIADDAIITALIADDAITTALIADNAVGTNQINGNAVVAAKLATSAVETAKINNLAVTTAKIANTNVTLAKLNSDVTVSALPNAANTRTTWDTSNNLQIDWYVNGNNEMRLLADGTLNVDGDVVAFSTVVASDKNLKDNIQNIENPIEKIKQLNGVTFDWKRNGKPSGGIIAQDVDVAMPSLVSETEDLEKGLSHKTVDYNGIIGLLVETVKEQQNQIDDLKARLQA
jgi:hypothetical protein